MSNKAIAIDLINRIPEYKMSYILAFLQGAAIPDETQDYVLNEETIKAMNEVEDMIQNGTGQKFNGSTEDFFKMMLEG